MFRFKQFNVQQDKAAMKVGTDAILLGAWANFDPKTERVLDVGAGTGILSLMLAQRFPKSKVDAVEIEKRAFEECKSNFEHSKWSSRLTVVHQSIQDYVDSLQQSGLRYDAIISNPPFFKETILPSSKERTIARNSISLSFQDLIQTVSQLLTSNGLFSTIIPYKDESDFRVLCEQKGLFANQICRVIGTPDSDFKRSLLRFSFENRTPEFSEICIENTRHKYTPEFVELTKDFYLNF